jgi:RHS repeat-associated protein
MTDPQGSVTMYDYDELNRLMTLTSHQGVFMFGSDDASRRESLAYPNGVSIDYDHDNANQLTALHLLDSGMSLLSKFDYTYDDAGNRGTRTTLDGVTTYTYDDLDRLTDAVGPDPVNPLLTLTESYDYDAVGNRISSHLATGQVHDNANRLLEDSGFTYTYDLNGNLASKQDKVTSDLTTYDWDVEDRLIAVHTPTQTVTFRYDTLGRRIEKAGATTTRYIYDQEDIIEERDGSNALTFRHVHGPGIDEPLAKRDMLAGQTTFLHVDGPGSITDSTNAAGQINPEYRYDSYGNVLVGAGSAGHAFTGREWEPETALFHYRERYYDSSVGRFISEDPLAGASITTNLYIYAGDSPLTFTDPWGLSPADVTKIKTTFAKVVADLIAQGKRHPANQYTNNVVSIINFITLGTVGTPYLGCGEQASELWVVLTGGDYDDKWTFEYGRRYLPLPHQWLRAVSSNPSDPVLVLDPWKNQITEQK